MSRLFISGEKIVTISELYNILGIKNLLTDDEMNIANTVKSTAAKQAITNVSYSNGISNFHYRGGNDYERVNWQFTVQPNTNYRMLITLTISKSLSPLSVDSPFLPCSIVNVPDISGDGGIFDSNTNWVKIPAPLKTNNDAEIDFNSGTHTSLALFVNFGYLQDAYDTDMSVKLQLFRADSLQQQINQLQSKLGG